MGLPGPLFIFLIRALLPLRFLQRDIDGFLSRFFFLMFLGELWQYQRKEKGYTGDHGPNSEEDPADVQILRECPGDEAQRQGLRHHHER